MAGKTQDVVSYGDDWAVRGGENQRVTSIHPTQADSERVAREIAINQRSDVVIHPPDGWTRDKNSHGRDPYPAGGVRI